MPCNQTRAEQRAGARGECCRSRARKRARGCQSSQLTGRLAHLAVWTKTEGGGLKPPGLFQPSMTLRGLSTGSLSDQKLLKPRVFLPACPVHRPHSCKWVMSLTALACCQRSFHWNGAVVCSGMSWSHTGVRVFHSSPAASSLDFIGGPAILLGLISLATDDHSMYAAVKVLHLVLTSNIMCDRLMQHICGYQVSPPSHPSLQMPPTTQQEAVIPEEQGGALLAQVDIPISMTFGESKLKVPWPLSITRAEGQVTTSQRGALIRMEMLTCLWLPTSFTDEFKNHLRSP